MYRRRRSSRFSGFTFVALLGMVAGVMFLARDGWLPAASDSASSALPPQAAAPAPEPTPTLDPFVQSRPTTREITSGATLFAPTAGISTPVIQSYLDGVSWDVRELGAAAGHLQGTAWLNQPGNIVLAGHVELADGRRGVFATISQLSVGDPLILTQDGQQIVYAVQEMRQVSPDDMSVLYPRDGEHLTLITCTNYDFLNDVYHERLVVVAVRTV
jgi:LPXTG-site transpeptidase (sortase) family protein